MPLPVSSGWIGPAERIRELQDALGYLEKADLALRQAPVPTNSLALNCILFAHCRVGLVASALAGDVEKGIVTP
jgi:hypothetical protein